MRHGKKVNHLGRTDAHRKAMLGNMASSLIIHKRITTTLTTVSGIPTSTLLVLPFCVYLYPPICYVTQYLSGVKFTVRISRYNE